MSERNTPGVRRKWRVVDEDGNQVGLWAERFDGKAAYDEGWALACIAEHYPGLEIQVQTVTTSEWVAR